MTVCICSFGKQHDAMEKYEYDLMSFCILGSALIGSEEGYTHWERRYSCQTCFILCVFFLASSHIFLSFWS